MRILVTGGAGFIGAHLCDRMLDAGHEVLCLDNFYTGRRRHIVHMLDHPHFEVVRHDLTQPVLLEADRVFHLACPASPVHYQNNPVKTVKTNVLGTLNMLGLCKRIGARMLHASTSEVYGDPQVHPQTEEYWGHVNPIGPRSCYDEGKRVAETLCFDYHRQSGVDIRVVRIFNTYGPGMLPNDGRVVTNFIVAALRGEPLWIYGDGQQTRSFCYIDDLLLGLIAMMRQNTTLGPLNLGNPVEVSVLDLAQLILELTKSESEISYQPLPQDDPVHRCPDITKARSILNWEPTVELRDGLRKTIDYFDDLLSRSHPDSSGLETENKPVSVNSLHGG